MHPIAFPMRQAGGRATDGTDQIRGSTIKGCYERTPFDFGRADEFAGVVAYYDAPDAETLVLSGKPGLFRT